MFPMEETYTSGSTLYKIVRGVVAGVRQVWNTALNAGAGGWETYNVANWLLYAIPLAEDSGSGYYAADYPANISGVLTSEVAYLQAGGSPDPVDTPISLSRSQGQSVGAVAGDAVAAASMGAALSSQQVGAAVGTPPGSLQVTTDLLSSVDDAYLGRILIWTSGAMIQQAARISAYDGTTKVISVLAWPSALQPEDGDEFVIV